MLKLSKKTMSKKFSVPIAFEFSGENKGVSAATTEQVSSKLVGKVKIEPEIIWVRIEKNSSEGFNLFYREKAKKLANRTSSSRIPTVRPFENRPRADDADFLTLLLATCTQTALAATLTVDSLLDDGFSNDSNPGAFPIETAVTFSVDSDPTNQATRPRLTSTAPTPTASPQGTAFPDSATFDAFGTEETVTLKLPAGIGIDPHFTALATDGDGNTSEFGPARSLGEITILDNYEN